MKTFVKISLCLLLIVLIFVVFSACSYEGNLTIFAENFRYEEGVYKLIVNSDADSICLDSYLSVDSNCHWKIYKDFDLLQEISNKTVNLEHGSNIFYVKVFSQNDSAVYTFEVYKKRVYEVSFDSIDAVIFVEEGQLANCPEIVPVKTGYEFVGWNFNFENNITSDIVINAIWQPKTYTVTLDAMGGEVETTQISVEYDSPFTLPYPIKKGYTFKGWYSQGVEQQSGIWKDNDDDFFTAEWELVEYSIIYNLYDGINNPSNPAYFTIEDSVTLLSPSKKGYTFLGWTTEGQTVPAKTIEFEGEIGEKEYYANWQANSYKIQFSNEGECQLDEIDVIFDEEFNLPETSKRGYDFLGWFYNEEEISANGIWNIDSDVVLTAKWTAIIYQIIYEVFDGENDINNPKTYTVEDDTIVLKPATKEKNLFCGWKQQDNYITSIEKGSVGDLSLTAHFESGTEGLEFIFNGKTYEVNDYLGLSSDVFVPESFKGISVTAIKTGAFTDAGHVSTITVPNSVIYIEEGAFSGCYSLIEIVLPFIGSMQGNNNTQSSLFGWIFGNEYMDDSIHVVGRYNQLCSYAFYIPSSLKKVSVTNETMIGYGAFENCTNLTEISLNKEIFEIKPYAFSGCSCLEILDISADSQIEAIGNFAFKDCFSLKYLFLPDSLEILSTDAFENWTSSQTISLYAGIYHSHSFSLCQATIVCREELSD